MSIDEIQHLDFNPSERELTLRERATVAFEGAAGDIRLDLLQAAHEKCVDVLGEMTAILGLVNITNLNDGDGEVLFGIDGLEFRVGVMHLGLNTDNPTRTVALGVRGKSGQWMGFNSLAELGRLLADDKVKVYE